MCGIVGFVDKQNQHSPRERQKIGRAMLRSVRHRGGEANNILVSDNVVFGHTRLAIVDLSHRADQPVSDDNAVLAFNGEIYNHLWVREKYFHDEKFSSHADTATLFMLLKRFSCVKALREIQGMYALSFFNKKTKEILLAVDKSNIKPLYFINTPRYFAWASEIKAFAHIPGFTFAVNEDVLGEYLIFRYIAGEQTLFKEVKKLQREELLRFSLGSGVCKKIAYCSFPQKSRRSVHSLEAVVDGSVRDHLMGDVPIGLQLSGGVDSSVVAVLAAKHSGHVLHTFAIGLKDKAWNEFRYSDMVANLIGSDHHKLKFSGDTFARLLPKLSFHLDEPIVHPNTIPMYVLARFARRYTKVLLTGEGADEVFHGYRRYPAITDDNQSLLFSNAFSDARYAKLLLKNPRVRLENRRNLLKTIKNLSLEDKISLYDLHTYLPHVLLRQDKAGMAANVENRVPYLYEPVVQAGFNLKARAGILGGKTALKQIALKYLPEKLVLREKCGFGLPIADWLRDAQVLRPHLLRLKTHVLIREYFHTAKVAQLVAEHVSGRNDHSSILFTLIALTSWHDVFMGDR